MFTMRCGSALLAIALFAAGCAARAGDVAQTLRTPRQLIPIPSNVVDIVPTAAPRPFAFGLSDIDFGAQRTLAVEGSADVARPAQIGHFGVEFGARDVPATPVRPLTLRDAQPIVAALNASGVPAADIAETLRQSPFQAPWQSGKPGTIHLTFEIDHPTDASARRLAEAVAAAAGYPAFHVFTSAVFALDDCAPALADARREALDNARTVALARAQQLRLHLGALLEVREVVAGAARGQCGIATPAGGAVQLNIKVPVPNPIDVIVSDQMTLTYAVH